MMDPWIDQQVRRFEHERRAARAALLNAAARSQRQTPSFIDRLAAPLGAYLTRLGRRIEQRAQPGGAAANCSEAPA